MRKAGRGLRISIRDLIIAVAIIGLMLAHLTHLSRNRSGRTRVTIRVFNKTSEEIGFLRYQWDGGAGLVESHGANFGTVEIAPGGMTSFRIDLPGPVDLTLSCTTPDSRMTSGPVRIDVEGGDPDSLDFLVRPRGIVRRTSGTGKPVPGGVTAD